MAGVVDGAKQLDDMAAGNSPHLRDGLGFLVTDDIEESTGLPLCTALGFNWDVREWQSTPMEVDPREGGVDMAMRHIAHIGLNGSYRFLAMWRNLRLPLIDLEKMEVYKELNPDAIDFTVLDLSHLLPEGDEKSKFYTGIGLYEDTDDFLIIKIEAGETIPLGAVAAAFEATYKRLSNAFSFGILLDLFEEPLVTYEQVLRHVQPGS